jgi:hypothetical protein
MEKTSLDSAILACGRLPLNGRRAMLFSSLVFSPRENAFDGWQPVARRPSRARCLEAVKKSGLARASRAQLSINQQPLTAARACPGIFCPGFFPALRVVNN